VLGDVVDIFGYIRILDNIINLKVISMTTGRRIKDTGTANQIAVAGALFSYPNKLEEVIPMPNQS
jgi:hypothetical protein